MNNNQQNIIGCPQEFVETVNLLYSTADYTESDVLGEYPGSITSINTLADGNNFVIATASKDGVVKFWDYSRKSFVLKLYKITIQKFAA